MLATVVTEVEGVAPTLTLSEPTTQYVGKDAGWSDPGKVCNDPEDGFLQVDINPPIPDTSVVGTQTLTYSCSDSENPPNVASAIRTVIVRYAPRLTLAGPSEVRLPLGAFGVKWGCHCRQSDGSEAKESDGRQEFEDFNIQNNDMSEEEKMDICLLRCKAQQAVTPGITACGYEKKGGNNRKCYYFSSSVYTSGTDGSGSPWTWSDCSDEACWIADFNDPGACCVDGNDNSSLSVTSTNAHTVYTNTAGSYQVLYVCDDPFVTDLTASMSMDVVVDEPPTLTRLGLETERVTRGSTFTDPGVQCQDVEDGSIGQVPLNSMSTLTISSITSSGWSSSPSNIFAGIDGGTSSSTGCKDCFTTSADDESKFWIRFDLGYTRIVHQIRVHKSNGAWGVQVGSQADVDPDDGMKDILGNTLWCDDAIETADGWQDINCKAPLAGRYVLFKHTAAMTICEIEIYGTAGPAPPSSFTLSGCNGANLEQTYKVKETSQGWPTYEGVTTSTITVEFAGGAYRIKQGDEDVLATACQGCPLPSAHWDAQMNSGANTNGCQSPVLIFDPADACTWLYGWSGQADATKATCADGNTETFLDCFAITDRGGIAFCPQDTQMCEVAAQCDASVCSQYACATDCSINGGGVRACGAGAGNVPSSPGKIESNAFFSSNLVGTQYNHDGDVGYSFTTKVQMQVTHLGRHRGSIALQETVRVTLWSVETRSALAYVDVGESSSSDLNYRYAELATPVVLESGKEYRLTQQCTNGMVDLWYDGAALTQSEVYSFTKYLYAQFGDGVHSPNGANGYPSVLLSSVSAGEFRRAGMVNFKFKPFAARVEKTGVVDTNTAGTYYLAYACVDTMGQRATTSRTVIVGCDEPYGVELNNLIDDQKRNQVGCTEFASADTDKGSMAECLAHCLGQDDCEAAEWDSVTNVCKSRKTCDGKYSYEAGDTDDLTRQVGYCKFVDAPPRVVLAASDCCVNQGAVWNEGAASCFDAEDEPDPTVVRLDTLVTSTPGIFVIRYQCTDSLGQTSEISSRNVTVKAPCATPATPPDGHPTSNCVEGNGPIDHGDICTTQCSSGWVPTQSVLTCTSSSDESYTSNWDLVFECGEQPCNGPSVSNVKLNNQNVAQACNSGVQVVTGQYCIPNCADGYVAQPFLDGNGDPMPIPGYTGDDVKLYCNLGNLDPTGFYCKKPAAQAQFIMFGKPEVLYVEVTWSAGNANDCAFSHWHMQARQTVKGFEETEIISGNEAWQDVPGCETSTLVSRTTQTCTATGRIEGATYEFRIKEVCTVAEMSSQWKVGDNEVVMRIVVPPEVLFIIPMDDVIFDPVQLMLAFTVDVRLNDVTTWGNTTDIVVNVSKSGEYCNDGVYNGTAATVVEGAEGLSSYVQLTGSRIIIIRPEDGWFQEGCLIEGTLGRALTQTVDTPSKPTPFVSWNFTYIDVRPTFSAFAQTAITMTLVTFEIKWHLRTNNWCNVTPNVSSCLLESCWADKSCAPSTQCYQTTVPEAVQSTDDSYIVYTVTNLFPGTTYQASCAGHKAGKPWILTEDIPDSRMNELVFTTLADEDASIGVITINITAMCDSAAWQLIRFENIKPASFKCTTSVSGTTCANAFGYTLQVFDYSVKCIAPYTGVPLTNGQTAQMEIDVNITTNSPNAQVEWPNGTSSVDTIKYVKDTSVVPSVPVSKTVQFQICPLAYYQSPGTVTCTQYTLPVQLVDIVFTFGNLSKNSTAVPNATEGNLSYQARRLSGEDSTGVVECNVSCGAIVNIEVSEPTFDWSTVTLHLGPILGIEGFWQHRILSGASDSVETMLLALTGQGTSLPLTLAWEGVTFESNVRVDFTTPIISVATQTLTIHSPSDLFVTFTNVPKISALTAVGVTGGGYNSPTSHIQLGVYKENQTQNLCNLLTFDDVTDWTQAKCVIAPGALTDLYVEVRVHDYETGQFNGVPSTRVYGQIQYANPVFTGLDDAGNWAKNIAGDGSIRLSEVAQRSDAIVFPVGSMLPSVASLQMGGAILPGYKLVIIGDTEIDMCKTITWINSTHLRCVMKSCLDMEGVNKKPAMKMYLGDLASVQINGLIEIAEPDIHSFGPTTIYDVGRNQTLWFKGNNFGELACNDNHIYGTHFLGSSTGAHITVGDNAAPCTILVQNNTYMECYIRDPIRGARQKTPPTNDPTGLPLPQGNIEQVINIRVGNYLNAQNPTEEARRLYDSDEQLNESRRLTTLVMRVTTALFPCPNGYRRVRDDLDECEACSRGRYSNSLTPDFPLTCERCPSARYTDVIGATVCKACPTNTYSSQPADKIQACLCLEGYYSQSYNQSSGYSIAGTDCLACNSEDMLEQPLKTEKCADAAGIPGEPLCNTPKSDTCSRSPGSTLYYVCKAYCPGGTAWPLAKRTFYSLPAIEVSSTGTTLYKPVLARCDPPESCLPWNVCADRYEGYSCGACKFGYFRDDKLGTCEACGYEQVVGMVIMAGMACMGICGGLFFSAIFMRVQADIVFKEELINIAKEQAEILSRSKALLAFCRARDKRRIVTIETYDVGSSLRFSKHGDLGLVFRVDQTGHVHIAGLHEDCTIKDKIRPHWKLVTVNGQRPRVHTEQEVKEWLKKTRFPLRMVFSSPSGGMGSGKLEDFQNDRKMFVMLIGVMSAFNQVSMFDFEWPPIFAYLADLAGKFSFNLNFFKPECSVETDFNKKWMGFLAVPYLMMIPLTVSYISLRWLTLPKVQGDGEDHDDRSRFKKLCLCLCCCCCCMRRKKTGGKEDQKQKEVVQADVVVTFDPGPIGIRHRKGIVTKVHEGGQADHTGIGVNWRILEVNGRSCRSFDDEAFIQARDGDEPYSVTFMKAKQKKLVAGELGPGVFVSIRDYQADPALNGEEGKIVDWDEKREEWRVRMEDGFIKGFEHENLAWMPKEDGPEYAKSETEKRQKRHKQASSDKGIIRATKSWLLRNAYARTVNMSVIVLIPFHLDQLTVPFACVERAEGTYFVSATPDTECSYSDPRYAEMIRIAFIGVLIFLFFYSLLLMALWQSFVWQFETRYRDSIPFFVGMVEVSVFGQRGYIAEMRDRVSNNVVAVQTYNAELTKFELRVHLHKAVTHLGARSRRVQEALMKDGSNEFDRKQIMREEFFHNEAVCGGDDEDENVQTRVAIIKGRERWIRMRNSAPRHRDGNLMTYGWVIIVNLFWRQILSLIAIKTSEGNLVVVGAAFIMVLHSGNITMLLLFKPYKSLKVSNVETMMLSALFMVLWCAVIKDLLSNHVNVHLYADMLERVNMFIDVLAIGLMLLVSVVPAWQVKEIAMKTFFSIRSKDTLLNEIYMTQKNKEEAVKKLAFKADEKQKDEDYQAELGLQLPKNLRRANLTIRKALEAINCANDVYPTTDQKRRFRGFVEILRLLNESPKKARIVFEDEEEDGEENEVGQSADKTHGDEGSDESDEFAEGSRMSLAPNSSLKGASRAENRRKAEARAIKDFLRGMKDVLIEWGYSKKDIAIEPFERILKVLGKDVMKVDLDFEENSVKYRWLDGGYKNWPELQTAAERLREGAAKTLAPHRSAPRSTVKEDLDMDTTRSWVFGGQPKKAQQWALGPLGAAASGNAFEELRLGGRASLHDYSNEETSLLAEGGAKKAGFSSKAPWLFAKSAAALLKAKAKAKASQENTKSADDATRAPWKFAKAGLLKNETQACSVCGHLNSPNAKFCEECGNLTGPSNQGLRTVAQPYGAIGHDAGSTPWQEAYSNPWQDAYSAGASSYEESYSLGQMARFGVGQHHVQFQYEPQERFFRASLGPPHSDSGPPSARSNASSGGSHRRRSSRRNSSVESSHKLKRSNTAGTTSGESSRTSRRLRRVSTSASSRSGVHSAAESEAERSERSAKSSGKKDGASPRPKLKKSATTNELSASHRDDSDSRPRLKKSNTSTSLHSSHRDDSRPRLKKNATSMELSARSYRDDSDARPRLKKNATAGELSARSHRDDSESLPRLKKNATSMGFHTDDSESRPRLKKSNTSTSLSGKHRDDSGSRPRLKKNATAGELSARSHRDDSESRPRLKKNATSTGFHTDDSESRPRLKKTGTSTSLSGGHRDAKLKKAASSRDVSRSPRPGPPTPWDSEHENVELLEKKRLKKAKSYGTS